MDDIDDLIEDELEIFAAAQPGWYCAIQSFAAIKWFIASTPHTPTESQKRPLEQEQHEQNPQAKRPHVIPDDAPPPASLDDDDLLELMHQTDAPASQQHGTLDEQDMLDMLHADDTNTDEGPTTTLKDQQAPDAATTTSLSSPPAPPQPSRVPPARPYVPPQRSALAISGKFMSVCAADGTRVFCKVDPPPSSRTMHIMTASSLPTSSFLQRPVAQLLQDLDAQMAARLAAEQRGDDDGDRNRTTTAARTTTTAPPRVPWAQKYAPSGFLELLSDERVNREALRWLKAWDGSVFGRHGGGGGWMGETAQGHPEHRILLLSGPPGVWRCCVWVWVLCVGIGCTCMRVSVHREHGIMYTLCTHNVYTCTHLYTFVHMMYTLVHTGCGKTTLAHVLAQQCGYRPVEVNASDDRSAASLQVCVYVFVCGCLWLCGVYVVVWCVWLCRVCMVCIFLVHACTCIQSFSYAPLSFHTVHIIVRFTTHLQSSLHPISFHHEFTILPPTPPFSPPPPSFLSSVHWRLPRACRGPLMGTLGPAVSYWMRWMGPCIAMMGKMGWHS